MKVICMYNIVCLLTKFWLAYSPTSLRRISSPKCTVALLDGPGHGRTVGYHRNSRILFKHVSLSDHSRNPHVGSIHIFLEMWRKCVFQYLLLQLNSSCTPHHTPSKIHAKSTHSVLCQLSNNWVLLQNHMFPSSHKLIVDLYRSCPTVMTPIYRFWYNTPVLIEFVYDDSLFLDLCGSCSLL